ncbi:uncharacterized protein LOC130765811 [Actinidia eriantha]|uniref:uncharacterized protein LOC130765811 n=1 Tax=Actinidia eriantha TaxID=165200 RepID=UPI0025867AEF|nr:uncharacterized protein LOC130765811 [Actinidia eriantha]
MSRKSKIDGGGDDDVDSLLRAAEDEVLLNLSVNSHIARGVSQSSYIDLDLDRRFQALKSTNSKAASQPPPPPKATTDDRKAKDEKSVYVSSNIGEDADDLFARFAALKTSLPSSSSSSLNKPNCSDEKSDGRTTTGDEVDEDEVQKLIQWAIDAARLDPSPPTDTDDDEDNVESSNDDDDDSDDYSHDLQKKGQRKKGKKRN